MQLGHFLRQSSALALGLCLPAMVYAGQEAPKPQPTSHFFSLVAPESQWEGRQFLQADRKGNVLLVRGDTLDVFPVKGDRIGKPSHLDLGTNFSEPPSDIALSPDGTQWAVLASNRIFYTKDGKAQGTPDLGWFATSVAILSDGPAVGVLPMSIGKPLTSRRPDVPPLLMTLEDGAWHTYVEGRVPQRSKDQNPINALFAEHTVKLNVDSKGRAWTAFPYAGRILRLTPAGRVDTEIVFGTGTPKYLTGEEELSTKFEKSLLKKGYHFEPGNAGAFTAKIAIQGITFANQDGILYLLLGRSVTERGVTLARYDPSRAIVETAILRVPVDGEASLAAGRDGLYFAAPDGRGGRWRISWESLNQMTWRYFPQAMVRGSAASVASLR